MDSIRLISGNVFWLSIERFSRAGAGFLITVLIGRSLGPENLGIWSLALAVLSIATIASTLGLESIVVRDITIHKKEELYILSATLIIRVIMTIFIISSFFVLLFITKIEIFEQIGLYFVLAVGLAFSVLEVPEYWFRAKMRAAPITVIRSPMTLASLIAAIVLVIFEADLIDFAVVHATQMAISSSLIFIVGYRNRCRLHLASELTFSWVLPLLKQGLPLLIASLSVIVYMRVDTIMISVIIGDVAVGIYGAAARFSEVLHLLPVILVTALRPMMFSLYAQSTEEFFVWLQKFLQASILVLFVLQIILYIAAPWIILFLFGEAFSASIPVLKIHIWTATFVTQGVITSLWLLAEHRTSIIMYRTLFGLIVNILLNLILIPDLGAIGASIATLISMLAAAIIAHLFIGGRGPEVVRLQLEALFPIRLFTGKWRIVS